MLINIECSIVPSLKVSLTFENGRTKDREIAVGDLCSFVYYKDGEKRKIEGKVIKIVMDNSVNVKSWYIIVDGSMSYKGKMERFCPDNILDVDIIRKHTEGNFVVSPDDECRITNIRLNEGFLQVSRDGGFSWFTPKNFKKFVDFDDKDDCKDDNELDICPGCNRPTRKKVIVEPVDDGHDDRIADEEY